jgi:ubiquinone/menaquinone biosynthesis C-methylase UbiE
LDEYGLKPQLESLPWCCVVDARAMLVSHAEVLKLTVCHNACMDFAKKMPKNAQYSLAQSSNFLPLTAKLYDLWRERSLSLLTHEQFNLEREFALLTDWVQPQPEQHFLDIGTSTGNYARVLAHSGAAVVAIDISSHMLYKAIARGNNQNIVYEQVNAEYLPYPDQSFDGVVMGASLNEFHNTARALEQTARVLKDGGKLFMMYLCESETSFGRFVQVPFKLSGVRFPNRDWVAAELQKLGLQPARAEVRRAVALELYIKQAAPAPESKPERGLSRAAGKPAREPIA